MTRDALGGPRLVGAAALAIGGMAAVVLLIQGTGETGLHTVIRSTARTSFLLFTAAFSASALDRLWPTPASAWLRRNRRYLGLSFATSHFGHLAAIARLALVTHGRSTEGRGPLVWIGGGLVYGIILAMALTSSDAAVRRLGPARWKRLHTVGGYVLWTIFFLAYGLRTALESPLWLPLAALSIGSLAVRLVARRSLALESLAA